MQAWGAVGVLEAPAGVVEFPAGIMEVPAALLAWGQGGETGGPVRLACGLGVPGSGLGRFPSGKPAPAREHTERPCGQREQLCGQRELALGPGLA